VAAADRGAKVALLERAGALGGLATRAEVGTICGLYRRGPRPDWAVGGWVRRWVERGAGAESEPVGWRDGLWFLPYRPAALAEGLSAALADRGVEVWTHATVTGARGEPGARALDVYRWDRPASLATAALVDTTGVAAIAVGLGEPVDDEAEAQAAAIVFVLAGAPPSTPFARGLFLRKEAARAVEAGVAPPEARGLSEVPMTPAEAATGVLRLKLGLAVDGRADGGLPEGISALEARARRAVAGVEAWLRGLEGWSGARVLHVAPQVGARTGRRVVPRARLSREALLASSVPADAVALGAWPMERWTSRNVPEMTFLAEGAVYGIGAGCLRAARAPDLWLGGRCVGGDEDAIASARVIGTAMATGYAAGALAAAAADGQPEADAIAAVRELQEIDP
jgi:hypothetical protein